MRKNLTVHIYFLIIISLSFFSTVNSFYLPPLIVVFGHMCLLMGALFCRTKTEVTHQKEEYEKVCERLFHLNNYWLRQKCLVSYSVLIDVVKSCICGIKWYVSRTVGCLGEGKNRTQKKTHLLSPLTQADSEGEEYNKVCECLFLLNNCLRWQKSPVSLSIRSKCVVKTFKLGRVQKLPKARET